MVLLGFYVVLLGFFGGFWVGRFCGFDSGFGWFRLRGVTSGVWVVWVWLSGFWVFCMCICGLRLPVWFLWFEFGGFFCV